MLEIVSQAIEEFYIKKNYGLFEELCKKPLDLDEELKMCIKSEGLKLEGGGDFTEPYGEWAISLGCYRKGTFKASYTTCLRISKVARLFKIGHCYSVVNRDKNSMGSDVGDCSDQPYTKSQLRLHEKIAASLTGKGYIELRDVDMDEAVEGFKMPGDIVSLGHGMPIFGHNVTVELLLFKDIYNILGDDE